jgi:hypothetical protein
MKQPRSVGFAGSLISICALRWRKLARADIALKGNSGILSKSDQQLSVPWEQVAVKRQGGSFVLVLNQEAMQKIQTIEKQDKQNQQQQKK